MSEDNEHIENTDNFLGLEDRAHFVIDAGYAVAGEAAAQNKAAEPKSAPRLSIPQGNVADLLEHQVAICAGLIGNVAEFIAGDARPENCFPFMDRIARLMSSSAKAGRTIGQLRGIAAETKQTFVKRKEDGREGVTT